MTAEASSLPIGAVAHPLACSLSLHLHGRTRSKKPPDRQQTNRFTADDAHCYLLVLACSNWPQHHSSHCHFESSQHHRTRPRHRVARSRSVEPRPGPLFYHIPGRCWRKTPTYTPCYSLQIRSNIESRTSCPLAVPQSAQAKLATPLSTMAHSPR